MIHVLVVTPDPGALGTLAGRRSAVELLHARDADEAVEKLGRNRRVDAVLLLSGEGNAAIAQAIREDILSPPPLFAPGSPALALEVRALPQGDPEDLLDLVEQALAAT